MTPTPPAIIQNWTPTEQQLQALGYVESRNTPNAVGRKGETTEYQILPLYRHVRMSPEENARWIMQINVERFYYFRHHMPTNYDLYIMWRRGWPYYRSKGWSMKRVDKVTQKKCYEFIARLIKLNKEQGIYSKN